jgi:hypothetical protein
MSNLNFDATAVEPAAIRGALPPGEYVAMIADTGMKATKANDGNEYLEITFVVLEGSNKGSRAWARLNLVNNTPKAVEIAQRELSAICHAVNVLKPSDSIELHDIPLIIVMKKDKEDPDRTVIAGYKSAKAGGPLSSAPAPVAASSSGNKPTPPWSKKKAA